MNTPFDPETPRRPGLFSRLRASFLTGIEVIAAMNAGAGVEAVETSKPDAVLLDVVLPDMSGLDAFKLIQDRDPRLPVIIATAAGSSETAIEAMKLGAYDYLTKPFDMDELEARVRALSRRRAQPVETMHSFGGLVFNLQTRSLSGHGGVLDLPRREVAVIDALMTAQGRVVAKADLIEQVYGTGADVEESAIEVHVSRLRKRLRPHGVDIRAQRGLGYRLVAI